MKKKNKITSHHVPPTSRCKTPEAKAKQFILKKTETQHRAYHVLFANLATYQECCEVLLDEWWTNPNKRES